MLDGGASRYDDAGARLERHVVRLLGTAETIGIISRCDRDGRERHDD
jgi:hypothetical protein